jgi:hypothetical protein
MTTTTEIRAIHTSLTRLEETIATLHNVLVGTATTFEPVIYYAPEPASSGSLDEERPAPSSEVDMRIQSAQLSVRRAIETLERINRAAQV